jgi:hypothetical protein
MAIVVMIVLVFVAMFFFMVAIKTGPGQCCGREGQAEWGFQAAFFKMHDNDGVVVGIRKEDMRGLAGHGHLGIARCDGIFHVGVLTPVSSVENTQAPGIIQQHKMLPVGIQAVAFQ